MVRRTAERSLGFKNGFEEKRERLLSKGGYSELGISFYPEEDQSHRWSAFGFCLSCYDKFLQLLRNVASFDVNVWKKAKSDRRKIVFSAKMALALILVSLLNLFKEPLKDLSRYYSLWAFLSVVVAFEFSIGATLSKGFSRGLGTLSAGGLALAMRELSLLAGDWGAVIAITVIFITGFLISYAKLHPTMKPYEYGFRVFLIICCFILVSGYRTKDIINTAISPFVLIALGASVSLAVNISICPIWAGEDLHNLVAKNFVSIATSLEGCVNGYIQCVVYERIPSSILTFQASDDSMYNGYRSVVESMSQEDILANFAVWEPPHGPYRMFKYPWRNYVKVSGALRHCAIMLMALHGCILSEIQAPPEKRQVFCNELKLVGIESSKVLRLLGSKMKKMEKLGLTDLLHGVYEAAEELQVKVDQKSYLLVNSESWEIGKAYQEPKVQQDSDFLDINDDENYFKDYRPIRETVIDIEPVSPSTRLSRSLSDTRPIRETVIDIEPVWPSTRSLSDRRFSNNPAGFGLEIMPERHLTRTFSGEIWEESPIRQNPLECESVRTYESASSLSLATFSFLLIEFVARLQNVVDSFEELSEKANFKDPANSQEAAAAEVGLWTRLCGLLGRKH